MVGQTWTVFGKQQDQEPTTKLISFPLGKSEAALIFTLVLLQLKQTRKEKRAELRFLYAHFPPTPVPPMPVAQLRSALTRWHRTLAAEASRQSRSLAPVEAPADPARPLVDRCAPACVVVRRRGRGSCVKSSYVFRNLTPEFSPPRSLSGQPWERCSRLIGPFSAQ